MPTAAAAAAAQSAAAPPQVLESVAQLPPSYRGVLLDRFGVLHDGLRPYPGAIEAVAQLAGRGCKLLIISNSSRRSAGALGNLERMGFDPAHFAGVVTSGEVTHRHLTSRPGAEWAGLGRCCLHLTWAARGAISLEGLGLAVTQDPAAADFVLAHGTEAVGTSTDGSSAEARSVHELKALLARCAARGADAPPMVVANPDVVTVSGSELRVMPGTLAAHYRSLGGRVVLMGKPAPVIYEQALAMLGLPPAQVVAVGDSLEHDVAGAAGAGVDSVFVLGGIHAADVELAAGADEQQQQQQQQQQQRARAAGHLYCPQRLAEVCASHGAAPTFLLPYFR